jgi:hypothetical protein
VTLKNQVFPASKYSKSIKTLQNFIATGEKLLSLHFPMWRFSIPAYVSGKLHIPFLVNHGKIQITSH